MRVLVTGATGFVGGLVDGALVSVERVGATAGAKRRLWAQLGRRQRLAVDLESAAWAKAAARCGMPWLVVRAMSDPAGEFLPLPFDRLAPPGGGVGRLRVAAHLAARPWRLGAALALRHRGLALAGRLAAVAEEIVR